MHHDKLKKCERMLKSGNESEIKIDEIKNRVSSISFSLRLKRKEKQTRIALLKVNSKKRQLRRAFAL